jgi:nitrate/TMAO reductase-like tetraheme cytochrome c subunit
MWIRIGSLVAAAWLVAGLAAAGQATPAPANDDCLACHGDPGTKRDDGRSIAVAAGAFEASTHGPLACVDCHADLAKNSDLPHASKLERVNCGSCHDDIAGKFHDSIHSWAREKAGLLVAPGCADCHGKHDIKPHTDPMSRVYRTRIPATCGTCHAGINEPFGTSVHAAALKKGDSRAPTCVDCHTTHSIMRADTDAWRLKVTGECGTCHAKVVDSFRRTFHGKVTELGFSRVAACADCHGAHDILPASDSRSMVSKARLVETCGKCHAGANERFVKYDPHPDPGNYTRSAVLWWANRFYWVLIPGCFGFFGLHSALWYRRSAKERRENARGGRR